MLEHPRAVGTDDLETFFSIAHRSRNALLPQTDQRKVAETHGQVCV